MNVVIIGAGPAGLAAAAAAAEDGADVTLLDASTGIGGQFWRHLPEQVSSRREGLLHHKWETFQQLRERIGESPRCTVVTQAQVWMLEPREHGAPLVHAHVGPVDGVGREARTFSPDALVLACGAHDRTLPFPGWTLPGVYTAGAAQALAKSERIAVGSRVVVAGAGPFLLPVAQSLSLTGSRVEGVYEAARTASMITGWSARPWQLTAAVGKVGELGGYVAGQLRNRIPYHPGHAVVAAHGTSRVETVTVAKLRDDWSVRPGTEKTIQADAVCVSHGFTPRLELAIAAGCAIGGDRFVQAGSDQSTSVPGVYVAGELTGVGGADAALAEGEIAGHAAAGGRAVRRDARVRRRRDRFIRFARRLDAVHGPRSGWLTWLRDDTVICRCEEVTHAELTGIRDQTDSCGLRSLKLTTRAGLGICQGRICGRNAEELLGGSFADRVTTDRRPLVAPVRIADVASAPTGESPLNPTVKGEQ